MIECREGGLAASVVRLECRAAGCPPACGAVAALSGAAGIGGRDRRLRRRGEHELAFPDDLIQRQCFCARHRVEHPGRAACGWWSALGEAGEHDRQGNGHARGEGDRERASCESARLPLASHSPSSPRSQHGAGERDARRRSCGTKSHSHRPQPESPRNRSQEAHPQGRSGAEGGTACATTSRRRSEGS